VQSHYEAAESVAYLLGNSQAPFKPARINNNFAYCGGGFGGRDHTPFPLYLALAAVFFPNRPVRLANNRFEQFQSGIKRHAFKMRTRIGVDRATGRMVGFAADHALDGGGLVNFSGQVASVAANAALGIYYVPKVDVTTYAFHSRGVTAGSMRCYGTLQTMTALEVLIDEICTTLALDPVEFRLRNALATGGRTMAGNPYIVSIRTPEILDKLEQHPIWKERAEQKGRLLHYYSEDAGRGGAQSTLGACDQYSKHCLDRRPCRHTCGSRGCARRVPLRSVAGCARIVGDRAERSKSQ
jgi:CO/xanthine dehydrogenase Mo-binding subunit